MKKLLSLRVPYRCPMFSCMDYVSCFWTPSPKELLISFISRRQTCKGDGEANSPAWPKPRWNEKRPEFVPSQFMYWPRAKVLPFEAVWVLDCENDNFCFKMLYFSLWPHLPVWWGQEPHSVLLITYHQNASQCSHKSVSNASKNSSSETSRTSFAWPLLGLKPHSLLRSHSYSTLETHVVDLWKSTLTCLSSRVTPLRLL